MILGCIGFRVQGFGFCGFRFMVLRCMLLGMVSEKDRDGLRFSVLRCALAGSVRVHVCVCVGVCSKF